MSSSNQVNKQTSTLELLNFESIKNHALFEGIDWLTLPVNNPMLRFSLQSSDVTGTST